MPAQNMNSDSKPTHDEIARRAQAIFEESGRVPGRDMHNWLEAESQLVAARKRASEGRNNTLSDPKSAAKQAPQSSNNPREFLSPRS
jgi:hypothetical protein